MTKKHFEAAAALVRASERPPCDKLLMCSAYIALFAQFNPRFDRVRFRAACGL